MTIMTHRFEDDNITYYTTSDNKIYLHKNNAEAREDYLCKEITKAQFYKTFYYNEAIYGAKTVAYEDMKQWLKNNQQLVKDIIKEL